MEQLRPAKSVFKDLMKKLAFQNLHLLGSVCMVLLTVSNWFYLDISECKDLVCSVYCLLNPLMISKGPGC